MENYEENRIQDISQEEVIDSLYVFFPEISEKQIKFIYHGTYNVFEVKGKYIFRFPDKLFRNPKGVKLINNEVKMVNSIRKCISILIPEPIFISLDPNNPFMGYEKLEGISLSKVFLQASKKEKIKIANEIGTFLSQLHSDELEVEIVKDQINEVRFTLDKYQQDWEKFFYQIQELSFPLMNLNQKSWVTNLFENFLNNKRNFNFEPVVVHGDFDASNILVDPETFKLRGIIDFEESRIYDPAVDFIFYEEGDVFLTNLLASYQKPRDQNFEERMKFLYGCTCLHYIKFGLENNITDMIETGFQKLEHIMKKFLTLK